jgi:hypothetical protein
MMGRRTFGVAYPNMLSVSYSGYCWNYPVLIIVHRYYSSSLRLLHAG